MNTNGDNSTMRIQKHTFDMSTSTMTTTVKSKVEPWDPKQLKKELKVNLEFYKKIADGLTVVPHNDAYVQTTKDLANELLTRTSNLIKGYTELYESTETKRVGKIKAKFVDKKLTYLLSQHFKRMLPDNGQYGIIDLNRIVPRAFSLIIKENALGEGQFFSLNDSLKNLFESPSIEDPSKTYLQCAQERIAEIRMSKDYRQSPSSAEIFNDNGKITMNYSALKIIMPKFGIKYEITSPEQYIPQLEEFNKYLEDLHNEHEENKKAAKKANKK